MSQANYLLCSECDQYVGISSLGAHDCDQDTDSKENDVANWAFYLIKHLINSGIENHAHWKVPESYINDFIEYKVYVSKPSNEELKEVNIDLLMEKLKPFIKSSILKVVSEFEEAEK